MSIDAQVERAEEYDEIARPSHYCAGTIQPIEVIEAFDLASDYCLGNVLKYVLRAGKKRQKNETVERAMSRDLQKAAWYLDRKITSLSKSG